MRISDWSSDVCSSDLWIAVPLLEAAVRAFRTYAYRANSSFPPRHDTSPDNKPRHWRQGGRSVRRQGIPPHPARHNHRSEEHTSELQSLMRISYAAFCLIKKQHNTIIHENTLKHKSLSI